MNGPLSQKKMPIWVLSDIEIANSVQMKPIKGVAEKLGITSKMPCLFMEITRQKSIAGQPETQDKPDGKLILVTAISPTPIAGEDHYFCRIGRCFSAIGKSRYRSAGSLHSRPVFGIKGGAAAAFTLQVVPMEDIQPPLHW